tara:strand:+ start:5964 stop:6644 length:681 start_codon:yes stop_codon:yes gene_type:complete
MEPIYEKYFDGKIHYFPGIIEDPQWILDTIDKMSTNTVSDYIPWTAQDAPGAYEYGIMKDIRRGNLEQDSPEDQEVAKKIINILDTAIWTGYRIYLKNLGVSEDNLVQWDSHYWKNRSPNFAVKFYHAGGDHGPHPDIDGDDPVGVTTTLYLNDSYDDGALTFIDVDGQPGIKPKAGSLVVFPSRAVHISTPISNGIKCFTNEVQVWPRQMLKDQAAHWDEETWPR